MPEFPQCRCKQAAVGWRSHLGIVGASPNIVKSQFDSACKTSGSSSAGSKIHPSGGQSSLLSKHASSFGRSDLSSDADMLGAVGSSRRSSAPHAASTMRRVSNPVLDIGTVRVL